MSSVVNLKALSAAEMRFVTRLSNATMEALLAELPPEEQQIEPVFLARDHLAEADVRSFLARRWPEGLGCS
jgi:hypothetical protein